MTLSSLVPEIDRSELTDPKAKGFLQLCSDRRFHVPTMEAFAEAAGLERDEYFIEAQPGGAPSWADSTPAGRLAYDAGARLMGWAAHGDRCLGFPDVSNEELLRRLEQTARERMSDFPRAAHFLLFGAGDEVRVTRL